MLVLHTRELKYAMPASIGALSSPRIGIRMCAAGRFVACIDCLLSVEFPAGAHYDTIAKRFESHSCGFPSLSKDDDPLAKTNACASTSEIVHRFEFDHGANPMWVFDLNTFAFFAVNDAAVQRYGYSRKEFLSMTLLDIQPSEEIVPLLRDVLRQGRHNSAKQIRRHKTEDGSSIDVEVTRWETIFNGCVADIVTAVDVTGHLPVSSPPIGQARLIPHYS
jgi:PAS domain S-box-containing protein